MDDSLCLPNAELLTLDAISLSPGAITLVVSSIQVAPRCPDCGQPASRIHSRYVRLPADLPCGGISLRLELHSRRFHCDQRGCSRLIFTERLPRVVQPYSRRTTRLAEALEAVAHALGGEAGARLAARLGMSASPDILLRGLAETVPPAPPTPRVLGVDDWALRKGQQYGTILVDLERRRVVDLLPDRRAETLTEWLKEHPGVEIIARDRGGAYADGAREGAPDAVQVADRWHLLKNLTVALEATLTREQRALHAAAAAPDPPAVAAPTPPSCDEMASDPAAPPAPATRAERDSARRRARRKACFEEVRDLYGKGYSVRAIAQTLGKSRHTVRKYIQTDGFPERKQRQRAPGQLTPFRAYLEERWSEGCHNATQLWREIQERGFRGACSAVRQLVGPWRAQLPPDARRTTGSAPKGGAARRAPAPRAVVWWLLASPDKRTEEQAAFLERLQQQCPRLVLAQGLAMEFFTMARRRDPSGLEDWIARTAASGIDELRNFGAGLRRDWDAVMAGLTLKWSNGPVEGQINRLKLVKRQMFGRAGLLLLRARVLPLAA